MPYTVLVSASKDDPIATHKCCSGSWWRQRYTSSAVESILSLCSDEGCIPLPDLPNLASDTCHFVLCALRLDKVFFSCQILAAPCLF